MAMRQKTLIITLAALVAFGYCADSFAKPGLGGSFGSRGARTFSAPPSPRRRLAQPLRSNVR